MNSSTTRRLFVWLISIGLAAESLLHVSTVVASMANVRFATHYKPKFVPSKSVPSLCDNPATTIIEPNYSPNYENLPCDRYTTRGPFGPGQVYVVIGFAGSEGVSGASFGVNYDGAPGTGLDPRFVSWTPCADGLAFTNNDGVHGDFPQPGGGVRITWLAPTSCQFELIGTHGVHAVVGSFYVYAYSDTELRLTPNNNLQTGPEAAVADCLGVETDIYDLWPQYIEFLMGRIGFGSSSGLNPCRVDPVTGTTWGRLKSKYPGK